MESSLKLLRTVQVAMLISIGLYAFIAQGYGPAPREVSLAFIYTMPALAIFVIGPILVVRGIFVKPAERALQENPENAVALNRWRAGYIVTFALSEAVALYGVVLRFVGIRFSQVIPFFVAGFILMLFFGPRRPSNAIG
jgi:F0F1-type ATP synthase membrane subunit c/vacuolar-type H+-ATPase subunit K